MGRNLNEILTGTALTHPIQQRDPVTLGVLVSSALASVNMALPTLAAIISSFNVTGFLIRAAIGIALGMMSKRKGGDSGAASKTNVRQSIGDRVVIYGQTKVGGTILYAETTNGNKYMHMVIALAGHEVAEIGDIHAGDDLLTLDGAGNVTAPAQYVGALRIKKHLGTTTQGADTDLVAESDGLWTSAHRLYETAYVYIRLKFSTKAFPRGLPTFTAVVKGKKVYDPRTALTAWSDNPALCLYDYLTWGHGLAAPADRLDDVTFSAAANICDESVALSAGGSESRYTINGAFTTGVTPRTILSQMMTSSGGTLFYSQGKWRTKAAAWTAPVITLTDDDARSNYNIVTRHSRRDNFNTVRGTFRGASTNYQDTDYPQVKSATFVAEDSGFESAVDLALPFTDSPTTAQRLAKIALYRNREQLTVTATFSLEAFAIQTGENIYLTSDEMGWTAKSFEVVLWSFGIQDNDIVVDMTLREVSSGVFDWSANEAVFLTNNTALPNAWVTAAAGVTISDKLLTINEKVVGVMTVIVTSSLSGFIDSFEVEARKSSDTEWTNLGVASGARFDLLDVEDGLYDVRARTINTFGVRGDWTQVDGYQVAAFAAPPADVMNFQINVINGIAHLTWDAIADLDLSSYIIRHAPVTTGASYTASQTVAPKVPRPATSIALPYRSGTYFIKAKDKIGNESVNASSITTNVGEVEGLNVIQTITESPIYTGDLIGTFQAWDGFLLLEDGSRILAENGMMLPLENAVISDLVIADLTVLSPSAEYTFSTMIDLGAKYTSRVESQIEFYRLNASGALFDGAAGLFDGAAGLFDGAEYSDVDAKMQVALTDNDPSSLDSIIGSPVYTCAQGDTWGDVELNRYQNAFIAFDIDFDAHPSGQILNDTNAWFATIIAFRASDSTLLILHGDGLTDTIYDDANIAQFTVDAGFFAGKTGTLYYYLDYDPDTVTAWWHEKGAATSVLLGSNTATGGFQNAMFTFGQQVNIGEYRSTDRHTSGTDESNFNGIISEVRTYQNITSLPVFPTWSEWIDFFTGDFSARGLKFKASLNSATIGVTPVVTSMAAKIDMPDRVAKGNDIVSGVAAYAVTYAPAFKAPPALGLSVQGMQTGDYYDTTLKTATGFTIEFKNSLGATISRTFDYVATGYGKVI